MKPLIPDGKISRAVAEGLKLRGELLAGGMAQEEADRIVGQGLKAAWAGRDEPWHYYCEKCTDTGWIIEPPGYAARQRLERLYGANAQAQDYMQACDPCHWRDKKRAERPRDAAR
jgi:hypothetical protein